jgi:hypothetical protein
MLRDGAMEEAVANRIGDVDARPQNRHGISTLLQRRPVGGGIDPARHPAHDRDSASDERSRQRPGDSLAVSGRVPGPDDRDARP